VFFDIETQISPEQFGQILVDDIYEQTPPNASSMITQIANAIRQQVRFVVLFVILISFVVSVMGCCIT
jgi:uncharacterized BrkB/YihY/UPF0761 family membrane protein